MLFKILYGMDMALESLRIRQKKKKKKTCWETLYRKAESYSRVLLAVTSVGRCSERYSGWVESVTDTERTRFLNAVVNVSNQTGDDRMPKETIWSRVLNHSVQMIIHAAVSNATLVQKQKKNPWKRIYGVRRGGRTETHVRGGIINVATASHIESYSFGIRLK